MSTFHVLSFPLGQEEGEGTSGTMEPLLPAQPRDGGIFSVLVINVVIASIFFLWFSCVHYFKKRPVGARPSSSTPLLLEKSVLLEASDYDEEGEGEDGMDGAKDIFVSSAPSGGRRRSFFGWITMTLKLSQEEVFEKGGRDALLYLHFEKYLTILVGIFSIIGCLVLLPINLSGEKHLAGFAATTVYNLAAHSGKLWAHLAAMSLFSIFGYLFIFQYREFQSSSKGRFQEKDYLASPAVALSVCIKNFPKDVLDEEGLKTILEELYPGKVLHVHIGLDLRELLAMDDQIAILEDKLAECRETEKIKGCSSMVSSNGWFSKKVNAIEFYTLRIKQHQAAMEAWRNQEGHTGCGTAFITFKGHDDARSFIVDVRKGFLKEVAPQWNSTYWLAKPAPDPREILWHNLPIGLGGRLMRTGLINLALVVALTILSPPITLLSTVQSLSHVPYLQELTGHINFQGISKTIFESVIFSYGPSLLLFCLSIGMPYIFAVATYFEGHHAKSVQELHIMRKTFIYLFLYILVLPSICLTLLDVFIEGALDQGSSPILGILAGVFLAESGSFFVNFLIITTLMGNSLELLRFTDLVKSQWYSFKAATNREIKEQHSVTAAPFAYSMQYSWILCIFATVLMFSTFMPLILPFGFTYFAFKYLVDKYNLCYVCPKDYESNSNLLNTALTYIIFCIAACQVAIAGFLFVKGHHLQGGVSLIVLSASVSFYYYLSFKRDKFKKKQRQRIDSMYKNRKSLDIDRMSPPVDINASQAEVQSNIYVHPTLRHSHGGDRDVVQV